MIAILGLLGCEDGQTPVLIAINDAMYFYELGGGTSGYDDLVVEPGQALPLTVEARHTDEIRFSNMPGIVMFDPTETTGTLDVFDAPVDAQDARITLWNARGESRDFSVGFDYVDLEGGERAADSAGAP